MNWEAIAIVPRQHCIPRCRFSFNSSPLGSATKVKLALSLFSDLVNVKDSYDMEKMLKFCLTVCKNYRPVSYHNWDHAFSVAHCMYWVIKSAPNKFSELEVCMVGTKGLLEVWLIAHPKVSLM